MNRDTFYWFIEDWENKYSYEFTTSMKAELIYGDERSERYKILVKAIDKVFSRYALSSPSGSIWWLLI
jgi:hypothetical protein